MASAAEVAASNAALVAARAAGTAAPGTSKTSGDAVQTQLSSDINFFLTMLTTQLKNQDPSAPFDTNQFTQQIAQFSGVQQQVTTNSNLEKLLAANKLNSTTQAVSYIGKEVESKGSTGLVIGGQGAFAYILPKAAASASLKISDSTGRIVYEGPCNKLSGRNIAVWDGVNSATGLQEPDGKYTISVIALDTEGEDIPVQTRAVTYVTGVETDTDGNTLLTDGTSSPVNFNDVLAIRSPSRILSNGDDTTTGGNDTTTGGNDTTPGGDDTTT